MTGTKQPSGFSLIELVVSLGIFGLILVTVTGIYQQVINIQRRAVMAQNVEESVRFLFEVISKEIRTAERDFGWCSGTMTEGETFTVSGNTLYLHNQNDECVAYYVQASGGINRLYIERDGTALPITPNDISVDSIAFTAKNSGQPAVLIAMTVSPVAVNGIEADPLHLETMISSRYYLSNEPL